MQIKLINLFMFWPKRYINYIDKQSLIYYKHLGYYFINCTRTVMTCQYDTLQELMQLNIDKNINPHQLM